METLLEKIGIIDFKYEKLRKHNDFNIFSILRSNSDEVRVHSRFIAELLDPEGSHRLGPTFLNLFLNTIGIDPALFTGAKVYKEHQGIDILIKSGRNAIILENKIWAADQEKQLERYSTVLLGEGAIVIKIIYLTLEGREPSDYSLGKLKDDPLLNTYLFSLSYGDGILQWLNLCLKEVAVIPAIRETLVQYKILIAELTGNSMSEEEKLEVRNLLSTNDNILKAAKIVQNWNDVRWHTEWNFWYDLEKLIIQEFKILPHQKYSSNYLDGAIHKSRNRDLWYGIIFRIKKIGQDDLCIFIERGWGDLYYGVTILRDGINRDACSDSIYTDLADNLKGLNECGQIPKWIGWKYFSTPINFEQFTNDNTLRLFNPTYREKIVQNLWSEIKKYINNCKLEDYEIPVTPPLDKNLLMKELP